LFSGQEDTESATGVHCDYFDDDFEEDFFTFFLDEDDNGYMYGMYEYAMYIDKYYNRAEYRQPAMSGLDWVERKLTNRTTTCLE
jgi:hypothetical protein